jgi:restriction endonuclease S subunit
LGLLEGLEAVEIRLSEVFGGTATLRFDPEYFNKTALLAEKRLAGSPTLGSCVKEGYRVVYESTNAIDREEGIKAGLPFFLQSSDISTPLIDAEAMVCVTKNDWERYPKGRIKHGEILIEVKGKAEKIAIVPEDFPMNTLVTGTCFKLTTKDPDLRYFLTAYLTCKYGQALKDRLKTNLLVSYIAKDDLYGLPIPVISKNLINSVRQAFQQVLTLQKSAKLSQEKANTLLIQALHLDKWQKPNPLDYAKNASNVFSAERLDAEFFQPKYEAIKSKLAGQFDLKHFHELGTVTKGITVPYCEDGAVPIIRSGDLSDIENSGRFLRAAADESIFYLKRGDVLISSIGFGSIGKVQVFDKPEAHGTVSEVTVIRQTTVDPYYLAAFLRSLPGQMQIEHYITGATGQLHLYPKDVNTFWIPILPEEIQAIFRKVAMQIRDQTTVAKELLEAAKRAVEIAIEDSETAALAYLKSVEEKPAS